MKKFWLIASLFITSLSVSAQEDTATVLKASRQITKELTPQQIIDSLHKRFPNAQAVQYYKMPKEGVENGWQVTEGDLGGADVEYYVLKFKNDKINYYGLYQADGTLVESKLEQKEAALPEAVKTSLRTMAANDYKGWKLRSSSYHKTIDYQKNNTYYEIVAAKGEERKVLIMSPDGKVVKEKNL